MPRNAEVIRQWQLLLEIEKSRHGLTVDDMARQAGVGKRTVWRDMAALQEAGFPLTSDKGPDGRTRWTLMALPLKALTNPGLSLTEVCSLYMSRALLSAMPGAAFADGLAHLMKKVEKALTPRVREFLDQLPGVIKVKPGAIKKHQEDYSEIVARLIEASSSRREARMRYYSASSNREKDYVVHPYHVTYFDGGLYLVAFVPEYRQIRNFAVERIRRFTPTETRFTPAATGADSPFAGSLGVNDGRPERVEIEFAPRVARYIREREWHRSQRLQDMSDGSVRLTMKVCRDWALRSWVLSFGPHARVIAPSALAEEILEQLEEARDGYAPRLAFELPEPIRCHSHDCRFGSDGKGRSAPSPNSRGREEAGACREGADAGREATLAASAASRRREGADAGREATLDHSEASRCREATLADSALSRRREGAGCSSHGPDTSAPARTCPHLAPVRTRQHPSHPSAPRTRPHLTAPIRT